jgi:molybdate transport system ATP-binding protein
MLSVDISKGLGTTGDQDFRVVAAFDAPAGVTILFGPSGSGKSTILDSIAGLTQPDRGLIRLGDRVFFDSAQSIDLAVRKRRIGYVFQQLALFPHLTVVENVGFGLRGVSDRERLRRVSAELERLRISHTAGRRPDRISGGEAQRVALARALVTSPNLILLDEPLSALDSPTRRSLISDFRSLRDETGIPMIYVTHSRDEALALGDRLVYLDGGRVVRQGEPVSILTALSGGEQAGLPAISDRSENILIGRVQSRDADGGELQATFNGPHGGCELVLPLWDYAAGDQIMIGLLAGDIMVSTVQPASLSARNVLKGSVVSTDVRNGDVLLEVDCGVRLAVALTADAFRELRIETGHEVWLIIKAHACRPIEGA